MAHRESQPLLLRIPEAGRAAAVGKSKAYELAATEWASFTISIGRSRRVVFEGLQRWIEAKQQANGG